MQVCPRACVSCCVSAKVISLADARRRRTARIAEAAPYSGLSPSAFYFDLGDPFTYLAAERVERAMPAVSWRPASAAALARCDPWNDEAVRALAEQRADLLHMALCWPDSTGAHARAANRAAAYAAEHGRGATFAVAATRLAFCGGFDLGHLEVLAEAAAAAGVELEGCLRAAGDPARDCEIEAAGRTLVAAGAERLPVLCLGARVFAGEDRLAEAFACARSSALSATPL